MYLLHAKKPELRALMKLYDSAKVYMHTHGNPNQWNAGHPDLDDLIDDIETLELFAAKDGNDVVGCLKVQRDPEPAYAHLGLPENYLTLHKVVGSPRKKRMGEWMIRFLQEKKKQPLVIDTHPDNRAMLDCLARTGFREIGETFYYDGARRIVFMWEPEEPVQQ